MRLLTTDFLIRGECRNCKNFIRVMEDFNTKPRGFCLLGQLEGDYSLYVSTSKDDDCKGYLFDGLNEMKNDYEQKLHMEMFDFVSMRRGNKKVDDLLLALKGKISFGDFLLRQRIKGDIFREKNRDRFVNIRKHCELCEDDYWKLMLEIRNVYQERIQFLINKSAEESEKIMGKGYDTGHLEK